MKEDILNRLYEFDQDEWNSFIKALSFDQEVPNLDRFADNFPTKLMWLYRNFLRKDKGKLLYLNEAVLQNLRTTYPSPGNVSIIYSLIYYIHEIKPLEHRKAIESIIYDKAFINQFYGSDNLHLMLVKAYINLEDPNKLYIEEHVKNLDFIDSKYYLYIGIFYYAYLGKKNSALSIISKVLFSDNDDNDTFYFNFYNALIDTIPQYLPIDEVLFYFICNRIQINQKDLKLAKMLREVIRFLTDENSQNILAEIYFLEDYFNASERNANLYPRLFEELTSENEKMRRLFNTYYGNRKFNLPDLNDNFMIIEAAISSFG